MEERVERILEMMAERESLTFEELFEDMPQKMIAILTFLAILELVRLRRIAVRQSLPFSELRVYRGEQFDNPQPAIEFIDQVDML